MQDYEFTLHLHAGAVNDAEDFCFDWNIAFYSATCCLPERASEKLLPWKHLYVCEETALQFPLTAALKPTHEQRRNRKQNYLQGAPRPCSSASPLIYPSPDTQVP